MMSIRGRTAALLIIAFAGAGCSTGDVLSDSTAAPASQEFTGSTNATDSAASVEPADAGTPVVERGRYQPSFHGLLVLQGGEGRDRGAGGLETVWRREGTNQTFDLTLSPLETTIVALNPGRYRLSSAAGSSGRNYLDELGGAAAGIVTINPGDVIYAGLILAREDNGRPVIEARDRINDVRPDVAAAYPAQAGQLRKELLEGAGS